MCAGDIPSVRLRPAMIVLGLVLILTGSLAGAILAWLQDASLWQVALAYVGGGWAGLLAGIPLAMALRHLTGPRGGGRRQLAGVTRQQRQMR